ncbi:MAG: DNA replication and repair protein RecF [Acidobacteriota bacterium]|nr:DNA replication and repair protein RecF [Acidobacteriota bacterium]
MSVTRLWLTDFRCFTEAVFEPDPEGLTVLRGENGAGKTSVLEAVGWLATQRSFRGAPRDVVVRGRADRAVVRAETLQGTRQQLVEAEIPRDRTGRIQVNRQPVRRRVQLAETLRVSVFSPEDLVVVQGGPGGRREYLDDILVARHPRDEALVGEVERVLRQRAALLHQAGGRHVPEVLSTLDVWDSRLASAGEALAAARAELVDALRPFVVQAHGRLAGADAPEGNGESGGVELAYRRSWTGPLADALADARQDDLRRQATSVGPHRDELELTLAGRPARSQASQGEQRSVALSLRLAAHQLATEEQGVAPVLLLDDVFSELDARRAEALVAQLPAGQVLLTTAVDPPAVVAPDRVVDVQGGRLVPAGGPR